ncbi:ribonuclease III family protein, partial [Microbacterium sp. B19]|uniref:ribonuclease III family protein n=1 Tax=Microbacterium sp. B19 TaxID=96765 RepID=UPI0003B3DB3F
MTRNTALIEKLGVDIDPELLSLALTHRSFAYENGGIPHNERLEFLGDSVLGQAVTVRLYTGHPELDEGSLAKRRASVVSTVALAEVARGIGLGDHVRLGRGEILTGGRDKDSILAGLHVETRVDDGGGSGVAELVAPRAGAELVDGGLWGAAEDLKRFWP